MAALGVGRTRAAAWLCVVVSTENSLTVLFVVAINDQIAVVAVIPQIDPFG